MINKVKKFIKKRVRPTIMTDEDKKRSPHTGKKEKPRRFAGLKIKF